MSTEPTFAQLCEATGKTDAELGALAGVKAGTVRNYRATNKPSKALEDVVGRLLAGMRMETPSEVQAAPVTAPPSMAPIAIDREAIPSDFEDNEDWHFLRIQDSGPGGIEKVRAEVAQAKAGYPFRMGGRVLRYGEAHRFSDNFVVMRCPMSDYLDYEASAQAHAASQWPSSQKGDGDGISTETKRETRFIEGSAGRPTGEPVTA